VPETAQETGADAFVRALRDHGVELMFGIPGSTEAALLAALRRSGVIRYVLGLHETIVVAMAEGYASTSGRVGVVGLHTSVGTMNGLSQIYNAHRHGSAIAVTACHKDRGVLTVDGFCAVTDLPGLARTFTKLSTESRSAEFIAGDLHRALHVATVPPAGPTFLSIPEDLLAETLTNAAPAHQPARTSSLRRWPDEHDVRAAVALIAAAERPILVLGSDAAGASARQRTRASRFHRRALATRRTAVSSA
jgi:benzoylformate decarboxylase